MQGEKLYLRAAMPSDMDMLFRLANDEAVRKNSFHTSMISYEEHEEWFRKMLGDDSRFQFILMSDGREIGQVRLTVDGSQAEIGYSIVPEKRGLGYGKVMLRLVKDLIREEYPFIQKLTGRVKPSNAASIYCFKENGFQEIYEQYEFDMEGYRKDPVMTLQSGGVPPRT